MAIRNLTEIDVKGKRVIVRFDYNVPLDEHQNITNEKRIVTSLPTIRYIRRKGAKVILMSHIGRPKGKVIPEKSLAPVAASLSKYLGIEVKLAPDCIGPEVEGLVDAMSPGDVVLLENLRFHKEEQENDPEFAQKLARLGDIYINDDFGAAHRAHASIVSITSNIDTVGWGFLLQKEIEYLQRIVDSPKRPFVAIIGGAKIFDKIEAIRALLYKADALLIGGAMTYTFFKAMGLEIGKSLYEPDKINLAAEVIATSETSKCELLLPVDCMIASAFDKDAERKYVDREAIPADWLSPDIGPRTVKLFRSKIKSAGTVVWNGPMGAFEIEPFGCGTRAIAEAMTEVTRAGTVTIVGGGESSAAISRYGMEEEMSFISTGGGALLELLGWKLLPGVKALER